MDTALKERFIGRKVELGRLEQFLAASQSRIAVIHGRRGVGKTRLIEQALQGRDFLRFDGLEGRPRREQIKHFISLQTLTGIVPKRPQGCEDALTHLYGAIEDNPRPLLFDEFQWMANYRRDLVSTLKSVWDDFLSRLPLDRS